LGDPVSKTGKKVLNNENGFLGGLLNALTNKKVEMEYQGSISFDIMGQKIDVPFNHQEEVKIN